MRWVSLGEELTQSRDERREGKGRVRINGTVSEFISDRHWATEDVQDDAHPGRLLTVCRRDEVVKGESTNDPVIQ